MVASRLFRTRGEFAPRVIGALTLFGVLAACAASSGLEDSALSEKDLAALSVSNFQRSVVDDAGAVEASQSAGQTLSPADCTSRIAAAAAGDRGKKRIVVSFTSDRGDDFQVLLTDGTDGFRTAAPQFADDCAVLTIRTPDGQLTQLETVPLVTTSGVANDSSLVFKQTQSSAGPDGRFGAPGIVGIIGYAKAADTTVRVKSIATGNSAAPDRDTFDKVFRAAVAAAR